MGAVFSLFILLAHPQSASPVDALVGKKLPPWGSSVSEVESALPGSEPHTPHSCPNEILTDDVRHIAKPKLFVGMLPVYFIDFRYQAGRLEEVSLDLGSGQYSSRVERLGRRARAVLGKPKETGRAFVFWKLPSADVLVFGARVLIARDASEALAIARSL
jgi:hypothetical protein